MTWLTSTTKINDPNDTSTNKTTIAQKVSLVMWAMINNNIITQNIYLLMILVDFVIQSLILISISSTKHLSEEQENLFRQIIEFDNKNVEINSTEAMFIGSFMTVLLLILVLLVVRQCDLKYYKDKKILFKLLSLSFALLRSFLFTIFIQCLILSTSYYYQQQQLQIKFVTLILVCVSLIILLVLGYLISEMFNVSLPCNNIPWASSSSRVLKVEMIFKVLLSVSYSYQSNAVVQLILVNVNLVIHTYKIYYRLRKSIVFNKVVFNMYTITDMLILHFILFLDVAHLQDDMDSIYLSIILIPFTIGITVLYVLPKGRFKISRHIDVTQTQSQSSANGLLQYLYLFQQLQFQTYESHQFLAEHGINHSFSCQNFHFYNVNAFKKPSNDTHMMSRVTDLSVMPNSLNHTYSNEVEESKFESRYNKPISSFGAAGTYDSFTSSAAFDLKYSSTKASIKLRSKKTKYDTNTNLILGDSFNPVKAAPQVQEEKQARHRRHEEKRFLKHLFKRHVTDTSKDFRIQLLKIYFIFVSLNNSFLCHFLLFDFMKDTKHDSFMTRCQKSLAQLYMDNLLCQKHKTEENLFELDLDNLFEINKLQAAFDSKVDVVTDDISQFWSSLLNDKEAHQLYEKGISISESLTEMAHLYKSLDEKQKDKKEFKLYIQMAAFYKYVVFKNFEYQQEVQKSRQALQLKKMDIDMRKKELLQEKGLVMTVLDLKKPMDISFVNKQACQLTEYHKSLLIGKKVNMIMPEVISDNHHRFIDKFMKTGKAKMLNKSRYFHLKQSSGFVMPVKTFLYLNFLDRAHLILMLEPNDSFKPFDEIEHNEHFSYMLTDSDYRITEISRSCEEVCQISQPLLKKFDSGMIRSARLEDLFACLQQEEELTQIEHCEIEVVPKYHEMLEGLEDPQDEEFKTEATGKIIVTSFGYQERTFSAKQPYNYAYIIKCTSEFYDGIEIKTIAIRQSHNTPFASETMYKEKRVELMVNLASDMKPTGSMFPEIQNIDMTYDDSLDLGSQSSQVSSDSTSSHFQSFTEFTGNQNTRQLPRTLKFILQIFLVAFLLMTITSVLSIALVIKYLNDAKDGIVIGDLALIRLNDLSKCRVYIRLIGNIANGYQTNINEITTDRFTNYATLFSNIAEDFRLNQIAIDSKQNVIGENYRKTQTAYFNKNTFEITSQNTSVSYSINLFVGQIQALLDQVSIFGQDALRSDYIMANPDGTSYVATGNDELYSNIIVNTAFGLYDSVRDLADEYNLEKGQEISQKITSSTNIQVICIGILAICGLIIMPLFGRVQERIYQLMKLFFNIQKCHTEFMLQKIRKFKEVFQMQQDSLYAQQTINMAVSKTQSTLNEKRMKQLFKGSTLRLASVKGAKSIRQQMSMQKRNHDFLMLEDIVYEEDQKLQQAVDQQSSNSNQSQMSAMSQAPPKDPAESIKEIQNLQSIKDLRSYVSRKKWFQAFVILIVTCILSSYFIVIFVMSRYSFSTMSQSLESMRLIYQRQSCALDVVYSMQEKVQANYTTMINNGKDEMGQYYINKCTVMEKDYQQKILKEMPFYLDPVKQYIDELENGDYCEMIYSEKTDNETVRLQAEQCKTYQNGIATTGFSTILSQIYQKCQQIKIDYENSIKSFSYTTAKRKQWLPSFAPLIDNLQFIVDEPQIRLQEKVKTTLTKYFNDQTRNFYLIFGFFTLLSVVLLVIFICSKSYYSLIAIQLFSGGCEEKCY